MKIMKSTDRKYAHLIVRFVFRVSIFAAIFICWLNGKREAFAVTERGRFFSGFSLLHILWGIWFVGTLLRFFKYQGSRICFSKYLTPAIAPEPGSTADLHMRASLRRGVRRSLIAIFSIWFPVGAALAVLFATGVADSVIALISVSALFIADLICVLFFCPFRLMMGNKCCADCLIANTDRIMIFLPAAFTGSFFFVSLAIPSVILTAVWFVTLARHPERFFPSSSSVLRCSQCEHRSCRARIK